MSNNRHRKHWLMAALLALLAAASGPSQAAQAPERPAAAETEADREREATQASEPQAPAPQAPEKTAPDQEAPAASPELFLPTEEISEDFAVPFPSDI